KWRLTLKPSNFFIRGNKAPVFLGAKIQASCKRSQMNRVQRYLPVGEWKVVDTVKITGAGGQYRPTKQQYKMTILGDTSITPSDYRNDNQFLDLANYQEIVNGKLKPNFLIDIMGQVTDLGAVATVQAKGNDTKRVHFRLRDLSGQEVACCLWGKYAEQIETHMEETNDETLICLIRFAKISEFRGEVQITNAFDASLVCLNPTMEEAIDFRQNDPLALAIFDQSNEKKIITKVAANWDDVDVRCISEILQSFELQDYLLNPLTRIGVGSILGVLDTIDVLLRLEGNLLSEKPQFYCDVCRGPCNNYEPKFKLHLIVKDDTETCRLLLLDTVGRTIIGSKAVELWDGSFDEIEDPEILPQPIRDLVGKSFCFGLAITSDNVTNGSDTFKVSEVWSGDYIQRIESLSEPVSLIETVSSTLSGGELPGIDHINENSSEDFSTPSNKRKEDECDQMDMTSTSKKLCTKINNISNQNECQSSLSNSRMENLARDDVHSTVDIKAVFKRLFGGFEKTQLNIKNAVKAQSTITPKTPSNRRRCVLGVSLDSNQDNNTPYQSTKVTKDSETKTTQRPIEKKQRKTKCGLLDDITNIANSSVNEIEDTPSNTINEREEEVVPDDDEAIDDCDDDFGGIIEELDGNLEFDCSSQESSDSENNEESVDYSVGEKTHCKTPRSKRKATFAKKTVCENSFTKSRGAKAL
ncbi:hypothetical protein HID58_018773, partial [Brassica napus]